MITARGPICRCCPEVMIDPLSVYHGVLLAEAMCQAGLQIEVRIGPDVGWVRKAGAAVVLTCMRQRLQQKECA